MIKTKGLKNGYYYYAENDKNFDGFTDYWRFIGKIISEKREDNDENKYWFKYKVIRGIYYSHLGEFSTNSAHFMSIKGVAKTIKGLQIYML